MSATSRVREINMKALSLAVIARRERDRLSLRRVTKLTGVSKTVLSNLENGKHGASPNTYLALCRWLGCPLEQFSTGAYYDDQPTLDKIDGALFSDQSLTKNQAQVLSKLMREAYEARTASKFPPV